MDSARWEQVQALFHDAVDLPPPERDRYLRAACNGDSSLIAEVLTFIEEDKRGPSPLDGEVAHLAGRILSDATAIQEVGP